MTDQTTSPQYQNCYVACLDILGFTKKVKKETLEVLRDSMRICGSIPTGGKTASQPDGTERTIEVQSRFCSDTIAFFVRNKEEVSNLLFIIRYLQDRLWRRGACLRGGISFGGMYWPTDAQDKEILLGPAWIEAHKLEDEIAIYPRIIVSADVFGRLSRTPADPFGENQSYLTDCIRKDFDGVYFLDLLNEKITRKEDEELKKPGDNFYIKWNAGNSSRLPEVKESVQKMIDETIEDKPSDKIQQKYAWLQNYLDSNI